MYAYTHTCRYTHTHTQSTFSIPSVGLGLIPHLSTILLDGKQLLYTLYSGCEQDVKSYMNVDIPESRIFTVNHKVRKYLTTFHFFKLGIIINVRGF